MQSRIGKLFHVLEGCVMQKVDHIIHCDIYGLCYHLHDFYQLNGAVPVNDSKSEKKWLSLSVAAVQYEPRIQNPNNQTERDVTFVFAFTQSKDSFILIKARATSLPDGFIENPI